ncbi:hypothetical protein BVX98_03080, partial [bacterium F11]
WGKRDLRDRSLALVNRIPVDYLKKEAAENHGMVPVQSFGGLDPLAKKGDAKMVLIPLEEALYWNESSRIPARELNKERHVQFPYSQMERAVMLRLTEDEDKKLVIAETTNFTDADRVDYHISTTQYGHVPYNDNRYVGVFSPSMNSFTEISQKRSVENVAQRQLLLRDEAETEKNKLTVKVVDTGRENVQLAVLAWKTEEDGLREEGAIPKYRTRLSYPKPNAVADATFNIDVKSGEVTINEEFETIPHWGMVLQEAARLLSNYFKFRLEQDATYLKNRFGTEDITVTFNITVNSKGVCLISGMRGSRSSSQTIRFEDTLFDWYFHPSQTFMNINRMLEEEKGEYQALEEEAASYAWSQTDGGKFPSVSKSRGAFWICIKRRLEIFQRSPPMEIEIGRKVDG